MGIGSGDLYGESLGCASLCGVGGKPSLSVQDVMLRTAHEGFAQFTEETRLSTGLAGETGGAKQTSRVDIDELVTLFLSMRAFLRFEQPSVEWSAGNRGFAISISTELPEPSETLMARIRVGETGTGALTLELIDFHESRFETTRERVAAFCDGLEQIVRGYRRGRSALDNAGTELRDSF